MGWIVPDLRRQLQRCWESKDFGLKRKYLTLFARGKAACLPSATWTTAKLGCCSNTSSRAQNPNVQRASPRKRRVQYPRIPIKRRSHPLAEEVAFETLGFRRFLDPEGYPAITPPWGTLSAIDLNTGDYLWKIPFGEYPELAAKGIRATGSDNYGGPVVTAGGLLFIAATVFDQKLHAYDSKTGELLWETVLPFAGLATPATYMANGKQYVVIASTGGQTSPKPTGGLYIAFALP